MLRLISSLRAQLSNWYVVAPIAWVIMRCPPRRFLSHTFLAKLRLTLKLRAGPCIHCRVDEFTAFVEVYALRDYDIADLDWDKVKTIIDVGANIGMATIWFAQRAKIAFIVAIEPAPQALSLLYSNISAANLEGRVTVLPVAIGAVRGIGWLHEARVSAQTTVLVETSTDATNLTVPVVPLGAVMNERRLASVDVLKLDCEGAEFAILLSAGAELLRRIGAIIGEYHLTGSNDIRALTAHLEIHDFTVEVYPHPRESTLGRFIARKRLA